MTTNTEIRPFRIAIPQADLDELRDRLARTRWPRELPGVGWSRGVPVTYLKRIAEYWQNGYDWRRHEAALNELPQFTTEVDGQTIHFLHVRSPEPAARPMLMVHGWPSSFTEFLKIIGPLTDPVAHGGNAEDAFHLVIPSIPGYGFSPVEQTGWGDLFRVAGAFAEVMTRLGYERFAAQGTDVGAGIVGMLGVVAAPRIVAAHINGPGPFPFGPPLELDGLSERDRDRAARFNEFRQDGAGYLHIQATRPQTLAYGLHDSPIAQLAWIIEKFKEWTDPAADLPEDAVDLDQLLTNVSIYWFNGVGASAAHAVYEGMLAYRKFADAGAGGGWEAPPAPPTAVAVFEADLSIRSVIDPAHAHERWAEYDRGGHFPAMEVPDLLVDDVRTFLRDHRS
jgi:pimeloyl-ACP methyl ester carboxylesterase